MLKNIGSERPKTRNSPSVLKFSGLDAEGAKKHIGLKIIGSERRRRDDAHLLKIIGSERRRREEAHRS